MIVAIDTETTGLDPRTHDIIQACFMPLYNNFAPNKEIKPFFITIQPKHFQDTPEYLESIAPAMKVNKLDIKKVMREGIEAHQASKLFDKWWELYSHNEPMQVLGQNFPFDRGFLIEWLGQECYRQYFHHRYRDLYSASFYLNDKAEFFGYDKPFPNGVGLQKIAKALNIVEIQAHDAFSDCLTTAESYRRMLSLELMSKGTSTT